MVYFSHKGISITPPVFCGRHIESKNRKKKKKKKARVNDLVFQFLIRHLHISYKLSYRVSDQKICSAMLYKFSIFFSNVFFILLCTFCYSGPNLDLLSDTLPFFENYTKLHFDAKHLEKRLNRGSGIFGAFFNKKWAFSGQ